MGHTIWSIASTFYSVLFQFSVFTTINPCSVPGCWYQLIYDTILNIPIRIKLCEIWLRTSDSRLGSDEVMGFAIKILLLPSSAQNFKVTIAKQKRQRKCSGVVYYIVWPIIFTGITWNPVWEYNSSP